MKKIPDDWQKNRSAIKAIQVAFDLDEQISRIIKQKAVEDDLTPSAQIRKILDLSYSSPKRPRLTTSLSEDDYRILGERYGIDPSDKLAVRHKIVEVLVTACHFLISTKPVA